MTIEIEHCITDKRRHIHIAGCVTEDLCVCPQETSEQER